jgi:hypothetical protein
MTERISNPYAGYEPPPPPAPAPRYAPPQTGTPPVGGDDDASMKDKAAESAQAGKEAVGDVAQTAAGQAKEVASEAQTQAKNLVFEARDQLRSHAGDQHRNAVSNLRSLGEELRSMSSSSQQRGMATDLVTQAADRTSSVADWLDSRRPEDLLDELRRFARRRPGAFLAGALVAGVVAGRLTRGAVDAHRNDDGAGSVAAQAESAPTTQIPVTGQTQAAYGGYGAPTEYPSGNPLGAGYRTVAPGSEEPPSGPYGVPPAGGGWA